MTLGIDNIANLGKGPNKKPQYPKLTAVIQTSVAYSDTIQKGDILKILGKIIHKRIKNSNISKMRGLLSC